MPKPIPIRHKEKRMLQEDSRKEGKNIKHKFPFKKIKIMKRRSLHLITSMMDLVILESL